MSSLPISQRSSFRSKRRAAKKIKRGDENDKPRSTIAGQDGAAVGIPGVVIFLSEVARSYLAVAIFGVERRWRPLGGEGTAGETDQ